MFKLAAAAMLLAGSASLVAAQSYATFGIDDSVATVFAGPVGIREQNIAGGTDGGIAACNADAACFGFVCQTDGNTCITYGSGTTSNSAGPGFYTISWKYGALFGPSCDIEDNEITDASGFCNCIDYTTQVQNTAFGCIARALLPSQAVARRRIARNRIEPGHVKKSFFEQTRSVPRAVAENPIMPN